MSAMLEGWKPTSKQSVKGIWLFLTLPLNSLKLFHTNEVTESDYFSILIARLPETEYWKNGNFLRTLNLVMNMVLVILQVRTIQRFCFSSIQVVLFFVSVFMWKLWFRTTLTKLHVGNNSWVILHHQKSQSLPMPALTFLFSVSLVKSAPKPSGTQGTRANLSFQSMKPLRYVTVFPGCSLLELHFTFLGKNYLLYCYRSYHQEVVIWFSWQGLWLSSTGAIQLVNM